MFGLRLTDRSKARMTRMIRRDNHRIDWRGPALLLWLTWKLARILVIGTLWALWMGVSLSTRGVRNPINKGAKRGDGTDAEWGQRLKDGTHRGDGEPADGAGSGMADALGAERHASAHHHAASETRCPVHAGGD